MATTSDLAAWVQAVGSVGAMSLTIFLWRRDVRERQRLRSDAQAAAAVGLVKCVDEVAYYLESVRRNMVLDSFPRFGGYQGNNMPVSMFKPPSELTDVIRNAGDMGSLAHHAIALFDALSRMASASDAAVYSVGGMQKKPPSENAAQTSLAALTKAEAECGALQREIRIRLDILTK